MSSGGLFRVSATVDLYDWDLELTEETLILVQ